MTEKPLRKPPQVMPETPEALLAFVSWPDYYEGETEQEKISREALCLVLSKRYAEYQERQVGRLYEPSRVWHPGMIDQITKGK
jgi:hypothetical protein